MSFPQQFSVQKVNVVNQSTAVTDAEVAKMVLALNATLPTFIRDWKLAPAQAGVLSNTAVLPTGSSNINVLIMDTTDISGTPAYHTLYSGTSTVKVFAQTILTAGGASLYEDTRTKPTVSQVLCHEVLEAIADTKCTSWFINPTSGALYASEIADPVDGNIKVIRLADGTRVAVSDWILPAWYDARDTIGPYNNLDTLSAPFALAPSGYAMITSAGNVSYVYGSAVSDATKAYLLLSMRTLTRVAAVKGL